mgnify:CR=1 FL=1
MDFAQQQRNPGKHVVGIGIVLALHLLLGWAMVTGLAQRVVDVIRAPIETKIIEETKPPPPPPKPVKGTFTIWMAGGGVKPGITHGASDDLGFNAVEKPVHVHDLQATILHLLGIDHERLTYRFQGRYFRLTDVHGHVVREILA